METGKLQEVKISSACFAASFVLNFSITRAVYIKVNQYLHIENLKIQQTPKGHFGNKKSVSDFDEIQNMEFLWLKDFTHEIWDELETFFFIWKEKKSSLILSKFFHLHQVLHYARSRWREHTSVNKYVFVDK